MHVTEIFWWPSICKDIDWFVHDTSYMSALADGKYCDPACCLHPSSDVCKNVHELVRLWHVHCVQLYCTGLMFSHTLPRIEDAQGGNRRLPCLMDIQRHSLPVGDFDRNCLRQQLCVSKSTEASGMKIWSQAHQNIQLQFMCQWHCGASTF